MHVAEEERKALLPGTVGLGEGGCGAQVVAPPFSWGKPAHTESEMELSKAEQTVGKTDRVLVILQAGVSCTSNPSWTCQLSGNQRILFLF